MKSKSLKSRRNLFMSTTLMCALLAATFSFDNTNINWFWSDSIPTAIILGILALILGIFWFRTQREIKELKNSQPTPRSEKT